MFRVYKAEKTLCNLFLAEQGNDDCNNQWYNIICRNKTVGIYGYTGYENPDSIINIICKSYDILISDESALISNIEKDADIVLRNPCGAYILDVDPESAASIQAKYGVICISSMNINETTFLTSNEIKIDRANEKGETWERFPVGNVIPTNSLVILDRYFFDSNTGETIQDSYDNFRKILISLLPNGNPFDTRFDILFLFGSDKNIDIIHFKELTKELKKIKKDTCKKKNISICLELLFLPKGSYRYYEDTHNREIVSNYYSVSADHKLKAFRNNKRLSKQWIRLNFLYTGIDSIYSDVPELSHKEFLNDIQDIINEATNSKEGYYWYSKCDGTEPSSPQKIINRFFNTNI